MAGSPQNEQEVEWIQRIKGGDRSAFEELVERYKGRVFSLTFHLVRRRDEVEDISQEIFIKVFQGINTYDFQSPFSAWLSRVAVNHCYDYLRRQKRSRVSYYWELSEENQRVLEESAQSLPEAGMRTEQRLALGDLVEKLLLRARLEDRVILTLKELEDRSVAEIGKILNLRTSTVKVRLHRARKRLLKDLHQWLDRR